MVTYLGDHYLEDTGSNFASQQVKNGAESIKTEKDLCEFTDRHINVRIPRRVPQWEMHFFENYGNNESAVILIAHHSLGDGLSAQFSFLYSSDEGTPIKHLPIRDVNKWEQVVLFIIGVFLLPKMFL